jgi:uridylate kinase
MKTIVISLGGSLIIPDKVDYRFLDEFVKIIKKNKNYRFVIVCGGGAIARSYITALKEEGKNEKELSLAGIRATRMNAQLMMQFIGKNYANEKLPLDMKHIQNDLRKKKIVLCGALRYAPNETSDGTAAKLAKYLGCDFINLTNVQGLYDKDPKENKNATFIPYENWKDFEKRALKLKFHAGQHFILDQQAAVLIRKNKIMTYILGRDLKNLENLLGGKKFLGTTIGP